MRTLSAVAAADYHGAESLPVREREDGVNLMVASVTGNLFSVLGVTPLLGRNLQAEDDRIGAAPVVAIGGAAIAALFSGWLETILYGGVSRHDPATIAGVALLMCLVTGVATYIPARRAASVEPTAALRER